MKTYLLQAKFAALILVSGLLAIQMLHAQKITFTDHLNPAGFNLKEQARSGVSIGYAVEEITFVSSRYQRAGNDQCRIARFLAAE
jgi:hypothetical protein